MSLEVPNTLATDLRRGSLARSKMIVVCLTSLPALPTSFVRLADRDRSQVFGDESGKSGCSRRPPADMILAGHKVQIMASTRSFLSNVQHYLPSFSRLSCA